MADPSSGFAEIPTNTALFLPSRRAATVSRLRLVAPTFVRRRSFSSFASTMSLEMSLAASVSVAEFWSSGSANTWRLLGSLHSFDRSGGAGTAKRFSCHESA
jgi:ABC-type enterobactin transport system permease subunit